MFKIFNFFVLLFGVQTVCAQGFKTSVSVKIDSSADNYYMRSFICDSFTCIFQGHNFLFYEKSYRIADLDLATGQVLQIGHLPPDKLLIENGKVISHNTFNNKMVSIETSLMANPRIPLQLFNKFDYTHFESTSETKKIAGVPCYKRFDAGSEGDSTIIWVQKDSTSNQLKSMFNLFFVNPPSAPIMEITMKNFQMTNAMVDELSYQIYAFETGDFSQVFDELKNYKRISQTEYRQLSAESARAVEERWRKEKGKNQ